jgi:hypothetical protein
MSVGTPTQQNGKAGVLPGNYGKQNKLSAKHRNYLDFYVLFQILTEIAQAMDPHGYTKSITIIHL